ncbi:MAG: hypothetical protein AB7S38_12425 [Vulcanimicrobiota bacterium]
MQVTSFKPHATFTPSTPRQAQPQPPEDELTTANLVGGALGATGLGLGLGYVGLELGMRAGMEYGISLWGPHPLAQVFGIFTTGLAYGVLFASAGAAAGVAVGGTAGACLGSAIADHFKPSQP